MKSARIAVQLLCLGLLCTPMLPSRSFAVTTELETPPPVSGRRLSDPGSILPADVLARVELLRANVELIRRFVGRPPPPARLLRVESAQPREVYSQALNLESRANRLAFEQVRIVLASSVPRSEGRPVDVFGIVDSALAAVLLVKNDLGIADAVAEEQHPESTTASEVFNAAVTAGSELNNILRERTSPSDVFRLVTESVHYAASLHTLIPGGPMLPVEPGFVPNKMPGDVYERMLECFDLLTQISRRRGVESLSFDPGDQPARGVTPNDVSALAALLVEELSYLHGLIPQAKQPPHAYHPGLRFPAHVYQRAGLLKRILEGIAAGGLPGSAASES